MLLVALATALVAYKTIGGVLDRLGHPGAALDDSYIHFQYARAIAEGHPLRYQAGQTVSTGATSVLWPLLLAPFYAVGFRDVFLMWPAWALSFVALGVLAWDAAKLTQPLAGPRSAVISAALVLSFGGHVWCAGSGMEVIPFAALSLRTVRRASEWCEGDRARRRLVELLVCANAVALMRPEGMTFTLLAAGTIAACPAVTTDASSLARTGRRFLGLLAPLAPLAAVATLRAISGSALTNTAVAKLLVTNPYYRGHALLDAIRSNIATFFGTLLNGEIWSAEFLPSGGAWIAVLGLVSIAVLAVRRGKVARGAFILVFALAMLVPCFYVTFLWNRLRYLWPFASGWLIGLSCLAHAVGEILGRFVPRGRMAQTLVGGAFVGLLVDKVPWVMEDVAQSASGIDRQQVAAGRWANEKLPREARIGINDAGAIAYFGNRKTFDIVGLTTSGEARYWIAGAASRFEHYEKMPRWELPTHFIVYPEWIGTDVLLGKALAEFTVEDSTILGGRTKRAYLADWSMLGSGELPFSDPNGAIRGQLDVADLESERDHRYQLGDAREGQEAIQTGNTGERWIADGGRTQRTVESFVANLAPHQRQHLLARVEISSGSHAHLQMAGVPETDVLIPGGEWTEVSFPIPPEKTEESTAIRIVFDDPVTVYHYWFVIDR